MKKTAHEREYGLIKGSKKYHIVRDLTAGARMCGSYICGELIYGQDVLKKVRPRNRTLCNNCRRVLNKRKKR